MSIFDLGPDGLQDRLRTFFARALEGQTPDVEVPILRGARVETWTFAASPMETAASSFSAASPLRITGRRSGRRKNRSRRSSS